MSSFDDEVEDRLDAARSVDDPDAVRLAEAAVAAADRFGDLEQRFRAREQLVVNATFAGAGDRALAAFAWCVARADEGAPEVPETRLLWLAKWIAGSIGCYPRVRRATIDAVFVDVERRFARHGHSLRPLWFVRARDAWFRGATADAERAFATALSAPRDAMTDCPACEADEQVRFLRRFGRPAAAIDAAAPLTAGAVTCEHVPARTWPELACCHAELGHHERAREFAAVARDALDGRRGFPREVARLAEFLARDGRADAARELLAARLPDLLVRTDPAGRMTCLAALGACLALPGADGDPLLLPFDHPLHRRDGTPAAAVRGWCEAEADALAQAFDLRDGTTARAAHLARLRARFALRW